MSTPKQNVPARHLSVRVPWHDSGWNGHVCIKPRENGSCMYLPRIHDGKDHEVEDQQAGIPLHDLDETKLPPCVGEKVTFMSDTEVSKQTNHPYASNPNNSKFYGHYRSTTLHYPAYSFSAVPYNWMLKVPMTNESELAEKFMLDYDNSREPDLGFENVWVQQLNNQRALLDAFINPIVPGKSLVFIYAPHMARLYKRDGITDPNIYCYRNCRHVRPNLERDDPVWIEICNKWRPRHFHEWTKDGKMKYFKHGCTSHTTQDYGSEITDIWSL